MPGTGQPLRSDQIDPAVVEAALQQQLVRLHAVNVPWAAAGSLVLALLFIGMQQQVVAWPWLALWLGGVVLALAWRVAIWWWQRRSVAADRSADARFLFHYRVSFLLHGVAWGAASALPMPESAPLHLSALVIVMAGITASNFTLNSFDLWSAMLFGTPVMGLLSLRLLAHGGDIYTTLGVAVLLSLGFLGLTARRAHLLVRENVALRQAEAHQHHLLSLLIETTSEGCWFVDTEGRTTDANPAMCQILGHPRDALLGRSIYEFVDEANKAVFQRQIARRAAGVPGAYEITLTRADGSPIDCWNQATPLFDNQGRPVGSIGMWTDISERKRAERQLKLTSEALRQKSEALEDTLGSISQGIVSYDGQGLLRAYNHRLLGLLELPESLFGPQSRHQDVVQYQAARGDLLKDREFLDASGQPQPLPASLDALPDVYVRRTPGGQLVEVRTRRLPDGGMVRTFADVTAYIEAQRALAARGRELTALLDAFPGYIAVIDEGHRYTYANQRFAAMLARTPEQILGRSVREVLGDERGSVVSALVRRLRPGEPFTAESEYLPTAHRGRTHLQVTHAIGADDGSGHHKIYAFAIDISQRKAAEAALVAARDEAERANRAKSQFLSSMSHELRTPLNAILGFGQLLATDTRPPLSDRQRAQMGEIVQGARHLLQLINELLDLAVVETGSLPVHLQPVALAAVLHDALALVQPLAQARQVRLVPLALPSGLPPGGAWVQADPVRLKQVLINLLGNAIKYNQAGGEVRLGVQARAGNPATGAAAGWWLHIDDTGPGLSPAQQARLFGAFERLGAEQGPEEGTGLGLALSRGLVRAMQGEIGVLSQPGRGSRFWVWLPQADPAAPAATVELTADGPPSMPPARPPAPPHAHPTEQPPPALPSAQRQAQRPVAAAVTAATPGAPARRLLFIEDNPVNQLLMAAMIDRLPTLSLACESLPDSGLQHAAAQQPDLILLDIQLPGQDGFSVLRQLKQDSRTRHIPVIAVSAYAMHEAQAAALAAGFAAYLTKPVDLDELVAALSAELGPLPTGAA